MGINTAAVQRLYLAYFNRPADPIGLAFWESNLPGTTVVTQAQLATIASAFSFSAEYATLYAGKSNFQIIDSFYSNLFGRAAEPAGLFHWVGKLENFSETFASIALQLTYSAQGTDAAAIANKLSAATTFTTALDTPAEINGYNGTAAANSARSWLATVTNVPATLATATTPTALNTAISNALAGVTAADVAAAAAAAAATAALIALNGTVNGVASSSATLTGTAGVDTIVGGTANNIIDGGAGADIITGGTGSDSITMSVTTAGDIDTIDAGAGDVDTLVLSGTAGSTITVTLGNADQFAYGVDALTQTGFENVNAIAVQLNIANVATIAATTAVGLGEASGATISGAATTLAVDASTLLDGGTVTLSGVNMVPTVTGLVGDLVATAVTGTLNVTTANATDNAIVVTTGSGNLSLTAAAASDTVTVNAAAMTAAQTITLGAGASNVTVTNLTSTGLVNGALGTGVLNVTGGAGVQSVTGGAGNDTFNLGAGADVMDGGAGSDTFVFGTGAAGALSGGVAGVAFVKSLTLGAAVGTGTATLTYVVDGVTKTAAFAYALNTALGVTIVPGLVAALNAASGGTGVFASTALDGLDTEITLTAPVGVAVTVTSLVFVGNLGSLLPSTLDAGTPATATSLGNVDSIVSINFNADKIDAFNDFFTTGTLAGSGTAAAAMTGTTLETAVQSLFTMGGALAGADSFGLFSHGGNTYLIGNNVAVTSVATQGFSAVDNDFIVQLTGTFTGTLDRLDFI